MTLRPLCAFIGALLLSVACLAPLASEDTAPAATQAPSQSAQDLANVTAAAAKVDPAFEAKVAAATSWFGTYAKMTGPDGKAVDGTCIISGSEEKDDKGVVKPLTGTVSFAAGDNAWMLISCALVLLMTAPGLTLFYGGLVRQKNVLATMMQSFALMGIVTVIWVVVGFSIAFAPAISPDGIGSYFGDPRTYSFLVGVVWDSNLFGIGQRYPISIDYAPTFSFGTFAMFQLMFAIITPALITGAFAERMKFSAMVLFSVAWLFIVYLPLAHAVWGVDGVFNWWNPTSSIPAFDFAGGTVVHISSGIAALMAALIVGKRKGYPQRHMPPHNLVYSFIGAALLWFGWFGFNGGSALGAGGLATLAFANTQIACATAAVAWPLAEWIIRGKPTVLGAISGAVAGLVAITPACGFVTPGSALVIGALAGLICFVAVTYAKRVFGYDDALDAFGVHGVGGILGAICTGAFMNLDVNAAIPALTMWDGGSLVYGKIVTGEISPVANQLKAVVITILLSGVASAAILFALKFTIGLRPTADDEERGLDLSEHGEEALNPVE